MQSKDKNMANSLLADQKENQNSAMLTNLNFNSNRKLGGLIKKDNHSNDDRLKMLMNHKQELQKIIQTQSIKHKQEIAALFRRNLNLDGIIANLEKTKIQNEQQIDFLKSKLGAANQKLKTLERKNIQFQEQLKKIKNINNAKEIQYDMKIQMEIQKLKVELEKKTITIESIMRHEQELQRQLTWYKNKNIALEHQLKICKQETTSASKRLQININNQQTYKTQLKRQFEDKLTKAQTFIKNIANQNTKKDNEYKILEQKYLFLSKNCKNLMQQNSKLSQQQRKMSQLLQQKQQQAKKQKQKVNTTISQLQQNIARWQQQYKKIVNSRDILQAQLMNSKIQALKVKEENSLNQTRDKYQQIVNKMQKQIEAYKLNQSQIVFKLKENQQIRKKDRESLDILRAQAKKNQQNYQNIKRQIENKKQSLDILRAQTKKNQQKYENSIRQIENKKQVAQKCLKEEQQKNCELTKNIQAIHDHYEHALNIQSSKCIELQQLVKRMKDKLETELQQFTKREKCAYLQLQSEKANVEEQRNQIYKLKNIIDTCQAQLAKYKKQIQNLRESLNSKDKQLQRKLRVAQEERTFLQQETKKLKQIKNQLNKEVQQVSRQNKKNKFLLDEKQSTINKLKTKMLLFNELEAKCDLAQRQKNALSKKYQSQIAETKRKCEQKLKLLEQQNLQYEQSIKRKIKTQFQNQNCSQLSKYNLQLAKIRRKSEQNALSATKYQQKNECIQKMLQESQMKSRNEIQRLINERQKCRAEVIILKKQNEEGKKYHTLYQQQIQDLKRKVQIKNQHIEQLSKKIKLSQTNSKKHQQQLQLTYQKLKLIEQHKNQKYTKLLELQLANKKTQSQKIQLQLQLKKIREYQLKYKQEIAELKESYHEVYNKYMRYKEGFQSYKDKFKRQTQQIINDQRYTEEILSHCRQLMPTLECEKIIHTQYVHKKYQVKK